MKNYKAKFKKIAPHMLATGLVLVFLGVVGTHYAEAASKASGSGANGTLFQNPIQAKDLSGFLSSMLKVVTLLGSIVVVFFIILAGFNYVTARGDEKKIQSATKTLTWTVVGAAVILGAQVLADAIKGTVNELGQ